MCLISFRASGKFVCWYALYDKIKWQNQMIYGHIILYSCSGCVTRFTISICPCSQRCRTALYSTSLTMREQNWLEDEVFYDKLKWNNSKSPFFLRTLTLLITVTQLFSKQLFSRPVFNPIIMLFVIIYFHFLCLLNRFDLYTVLYCIVALYMLQVHCLAPLSLRQFGLVSTRSDTERTFLFCFAV